MITVVCTGGEAPPSLLSLAWIEASQRTIAADGGLALLKNLNRKADLWIGDGDSLDGPLALWADWYQEAKFLDSAKDDSDTDAAVNAALEWGSHEVWLLGGAGGRMDHWWSNLRLVARQPALTRWLTRNEEAWNLGPGDRVTLNRGVVSVFPLGSGPWQIGSEGLRWPLDAVNFNQWHSLSNEILSPKGSLAVQAGRFLVIRPLEQP